MKPEIKLQNVRGAPRGAAVFIVDSLILAPSFFAVKIIVKSINYQDCRIHTRFWPSPPKE